MWWRTAESLHNKQLVVLELNVRVASGTVVLEHDRQPKGKDEGDLVNP